MNVLNYLKRDWLALLLVIVPPVLMLLLWNQLPERIATNWDLEGNVSGYQSRPAFLISFIAVNIILYLSIYIIPYIDPKSHAKRIAKPLRIIRITTMGAMALISGGILLKAAGYQVDINLIGKITPILLYLVLGNLMSKFPPNYFMGIRTPWTLEHPEIWRRVHRFAAKFWVAGSLVLLPFMFLLNSTAYFTLFITVTAILILVPTFQSYMLYQKLEQRKA